jgi:hypothetical protein
MRKEEKESYLDEKLKKWPSLQPINRAWLERDDSQSSLSELEENKDIDKVLEQLEDNGLYLNAAFATAYEKGNVVQNIFITTGEKNRRRSLKHLLSKWIKWVI